MIELEELEGIIGHIHGEFEQVHAVREAALKQARSLIRMCALTIRALHREEWESAETQLAQAKAATQAIILVTKSHSKIFYAGYTQGAIKEYVEAELTMAMMRQKPLPGPAELGVESNTWINGLAEATTEMRRRILDIIRHGHSEEAERLLGVMDEVYSILVTIDFHDSITGGLRRRTDTVRAVLERTRGDVTNSFRQAALESALQTLEKRMNTAE